MPEELIREFQFLVTDYDTYEREAARTQDACARRIYEKQKTELAKRLTRILVELINLIPAKHLGEVTYYSKSTKNFCSIMGLWIKKEPKAHLLVVKSFTDFPVVQFSLDKKGKAIKIDKSPIADVARPSWNNIGENVIPEIEKICCS